MAIVKLETVKLKSENVIGLQKTNKTSKKHFRGFPKSLELICSEHININLVYYTQFHLSKK